MAKNATTDVPFAMRFFSISSYSFSNLKRGVPSVFLSFVLSILRMYAMSLEKQYLNVTNERATLLYYLLVHILF